MDLKQMRRRRKVQYWKKLLSELKADEIRQWLNAHARIVGIVAALVLFGALLAVFRSGNGSGPPAAVDEEYYFDLNNDELFTALRDQIPPIDAPSGPHQGEPGGVRAYVFTCGACRKGEWKIGYLEKFTPAARLILLEHRRKLEENPEGPRAFLNPDQVKGALAKGWLIRAADGGPWLTVDSAEAREIRDRGRVCGEMRLAKPCYPR